MDEITQSGLPLSSDHLTRSLPLPSPPQSQGHSRTSYPEEPNASSDDAVPDHDDDSLNEELDGGSLDKFFSIHQKNVRRTSWQRSMLELNKNLQKICGPTQSSGSEQMSQSLCNSPVSLYKQFSMSGALNSNNRDEKSSGYWGSGSIDDDAFNSSSPVRFSATPPNATKISQVRRNQSSLRRSDSLMESSSQKCIAVRHIETHDRLHNQLLKITGGDKALKNKLWMFGKFPEDRPGSSQEIQLGNFRSFDSASLDGYWLDIDSQHVDIEDLVVQVDRYCSQVTVQSRQLFDESTDISSQDFQLETPINRSCVCLVEPDGRLKICRQSSKVVSVDYRLPSGCFYLPVIKGDDGEFVVSVCVPNVLRYEDLSVKTIDEKLIINSHKRRYSANYTSPSLRQAGFFAKTIDGPSDGFRLDRLSKSPDFNDCSHFHIMVRLPDTVDTRSVSSYLNHNNLLIIKTNGLQGALYD